MRHTLPGLAPALLACAMLSAQQAPTTPAASDTAQATPPVSTEAPSSRQDAALPPGTPPAQPSDDAISRGRAKAAERTQKEKAKEEARQQKQLEKDKKEAEQEAKFLKLQDNEIAVAAFDEQGNPIKLPPCSKKDKVCQQKRKDLLHQKTIGLNVENGTLTVDGWTGKARLNYQVANFKYLYISVPDYGTVVASPEHFLNAKELKDALDGQTLTITTEDDRTIQLASDKILTSKQKRAIFYRVDREYHQPGNFPSVGYGFVTKAPYSWPGTLPPTDDQKRLLARAPELPKGMEARGMVLPCQPVIAGEAPKPVKINGVMVTPPVCKVSAAAATGTMSTTERPPDGSGAASTGVAENHYREPGRAEAR